VAGCGGDVGEVVGALKAAGTAEAAGAAATFKTLTALSCTEESMALTGLH
jgi:hypothetical protein